MAERIINKKDCGIYYCYAGYKKQFRKGYYYRMTDVQEGGSVIVMHDQSDKAIGISPLFLRTHFQKVSLWNGPDHFQLQVLGDPREFETTDMHLLDGDGHLVAEWTQDWTEFDDSGERMHYGKYAPWTQMFLGDIIYAGCEDIPDEVNLWNFRHHRPVEGEWPRKLKK